MGLTYEPARLELLSYLIISHSLTPPLQHYTPGSSLSTPATRPLLAWECWAESPDGSCCPCCSQLPFWTITGESPWAFLGVQLHATLTTSTLPPVRMLTIFFPSPLLSKITFSFWEPFSFGILFSTHPSSPEFS